MRHRIASAQRLTSGVLPVLFIRHHRPRAGKGSMDAASFPEPRASSNHANSHYDPALERRRAAWGKGSTRRYE